MPSYSRIKDHIRYIVSICRRKNHFATDYYGNFTNMSLRKYLQSFDFAILITGLLKLHIQFGYEDNDGITFLYYFSLKTDFIFKQETLHLHSEYIISYLANKIILHQCDDRFGSKICGCYSASKILCLCAIFFQS